MKNTTIPNPTPEIHPNVCQILKFKTFDQQTFQMFAQTFYIKRFELFVLQTYHLKKMYETSMKTFVRHDLQ